MSGTGGDNDASIVANKVGYAPPRGQPFQKRTLWQSQWQAAKSKGR